MAKKAKAVKLPKGYVIVRKAELEGIKIRVANLEDAAWWLLQEVNDILPTESN